MTLPSVSIVVVNWNGWRHLKTCLESVRALDYPRDLLEVIVVDNGSTDGSPDHLVREFPEVRLLRNEHNLGFARANNQAAEAASGEYLALVNNDCSLSTDWLRQMVGTAQQGEPELAAVASRIVSWDGQTLHFGGGGSNFHGIGFQVGMGRPATPPDADADVRPTLFACGAAMLVGRERFLDVGGFDEDFFAFYEDVDLGWRLWVMGYQVLYTPAAVAYHRHSETARTVPLHQLRVLHLRNPLQMVFKNYGDELLSPMLAAALFLSLQRTLLLAQVDARPFRIATTPRPAPHLASRLLGRLRSALPVACSGDRVGVPKLAVADLVAYTDVLASLPQLVAKRHEVQRRRRTRDEAILPLFRQPLWMVEDREPYVRLFDTVTSFFSLDQVFSGARPVRAAVPD